MPKETTPKISSHRTEEIKLAYNLEFRNMLREHPGIIKTAIELADRAVAEYDPPNNPIKLSHNREVKFDREKVKWLEEVRHFMEKGGKVQYQPSGEPITIHAGWEELTIGRGTVLVPGKPVRDNTTGLEIIVLGRINSAKGLLGNRPERSDYLKMTLDEKSFFVKRSWATTNPGIVEFHNTLSAKEMLKDLDFVKVVDAQLGYLDKNESWYVSKWEDLQKDGYFPLTSNLDDYGKDIIAEYRNLIGQNRNIGEKVALIREKLAPLNIQDLDANLLYSLKTKTFVLFDVTTMNPETLGQP
jgi:hypothetical protein